MPCRLCHQTLFLIRLQNLVSVHLEHLGSQAFPLEDTWQAPKAGPFAACLDLVVTSTGPSCVLWLCLGSYCSNVLAMVWGWGQWHGYAGTEGSPA